jgi:peroxin-1
VRWKLKIGLNTTVTLTILSHFEVNDLLLSRGNESLQTCHLKIQRVVLEFPNNARWTTPVSSGRNAVVPGVKGQPIPCKENFLELPDSMHDIPIQDNTVVSIPWTGSSNQMLYRILLDGSTDKVNHGQPFVLAGDLQNIVLRSFELSVSDKPSEVIIEELHLMSVSRFWMGVQIMEHVVFTRDLISCLHNVVHRGGIVIYGEEGSGKTHTALTIASSFRLKRNFHIAYVDCRCLKDSSNIRMSTLLSELALVFENAHENSPCVVVLDDLDELTRSNNASGAADDSSQFYQVNPVELDQSKLVVDCLRSLLIRLKSEEHITAFIITCRSAQSLPESFLSDFEPDEKLNVKPLDENDRIKLYKVLASQKFLHNAWKPVGSWCREFGEKTKGFRPRDLEQIAARVHLKLNMQLSSSLETATMQELETFVPLSKHGISTEVKTSIRWSDIGGLFDAKSQLSSSIIKPTMYRRIYDRVSIKLPRGILLFGFPGTGKSICVPALAEACGFSLIICRGPELLDKYIGASEFKVRELFFRAASAAPSILFFDELDALAPRRGSDHTGVTDRIVNQLLTFLDGVENTSNAGPVYVIAATSRPDKIDPALLRPGRLEKHIFIGYPGGIEEWTDLLTKVASRYNVDEETLNCISSGDFLRRIVTEISALPSNLSAADVKAVFNAAQLNAIHEALDSGRANDVVPVRYKHIISAFLAAQPSLPRSDFLQLNAIYREYRHHVHTPSQSAADMASGSRTSPDRPLRTALK